MPDLSNVPLRDIVARNPNGEEMKLADMLPLAVRVEQRDTMRTAIERQIDPWKLVAPDEAD